jgi:hypothetical protein
MFDLEDQYMYKRSTILNLEVPTKYSEAYHGCEISADWLFANGGLEIIFPSIASIY